MPLTPPPRPHDGDGAQWSGDRLLFPSPVVFAATLAAWLVVILWSRTLDVAIDWSGSVRGVLQAMVLYIPGALILLRLGNIRTPSRRRFLYLVGLCLIGYAAVAFASPLIALSQTLLMVGPRPFWDEVLVKPELWIGFDWNAYYQTVAATDWLRETLNTTYRRLSFGLLIAVPLALLLRPDTRHAKIFITANLLSVTVCALIGAHFPVLGTVSYYAPVPHNFEIYGGVPGSYHIPTLANLWTAQTPVIDTARLVGLIAFPSYHTAAAILVSVALWRTWAFLPALIFTVLSIAATPINGSHYLIDLVAGAALVALLVWLLGRCFPPAAHGRP